MDLLELDFAAEATLDGAGGAVVHLPAVPVQDVLRLELPVTARALVRALQGEPCDWWV